MEVKQGTDAGWLDSLLTARIIQQVDSNIYVSIPPPLYI